MVRILISLLGRKISNIYSIVENCIMHLQVLTTQPQNLTTVLSFLYTCLFLAFRDYFEIYYNSPGYHLIELSVFPYVVLRSKRLLYLFLYNTFTLREFHTTYLLDHCLSYFGFATIRHNDKGNLQIKSLLEPYSCRGFQSKSIMVGRIVVDRQTQFWSCN